MLYKNIPGVPDFSVDVYRNRQTRFCVCIPIINEGVRIYHELQRAVHVGEGDAHGGFP